jgi:hypothetical protein
MFPGHGTHILYGHGKCFPGYRTFIMGHGNNLSRT